MYSLLPCAKLLSMDLQEEILKILKEKGLVTVRQYAEKNNLCEWYVAKLCRTKKLKAYKLKPGNMWVIENSEEKKPQEE